MGQSDDPLLGDYLAEWLERRRSQLRPTTLRCYRQAVDSYVVPHLGDSRLSQLDRVLLEDVYVDLLEAGGLHGKPLSVRTVRLAHKVLHRAMRDAVLAIRIVHPAGSWRVGHCRRTWVISVRQSSRWQRVLCRGRCDGGLATSKKAWARSPQPHITVTLE